MSSGSESGAAAEGESGGDVSDFEAPDSADAAPRPRGRPRTRPRTLSNPHRPGAVRASRRGRGARAAFCHRRRRATGRTATADHLHVHPDLEQNRRARRSCARPSASASWRPT